MPVQTLTRARLRQLSLVYAGQSDAQNFYGQAVNDWLNWALMDMYGDYGIETRVEGVCSPGIAELLMPMGFLWEKRVVVNGQELSYRATTSEQDRFTGGQSLPTWYTHWGKPYTVLELGPMPPDSAYVFSVEFYRTPRELTVDAQVPEIPPKWAMALPKYTAAQIIMADGLVHLTQKYQALMGEYKELKQEFQGFFSAETRSEYPTPTFSEDY